MGSASILDKIVAEKRKEVDRKLRLVPQRALEARMREEPTVRPFGRALRGDRIAVIAEVKRASPSKGVLAPDFDHLRVAEGYERGGAAAVSVLTDEPFFGGDLAFLPQIRDVCSRPLLRKDFIIDPYQVYEARAWRADAVLLIAAALDPGLFQDLLALTYELGMDALVEVHTAEELAWTLDRGARIIGVNNRDLRTFHTTLEVTEQLAPHIPDEVLLVSESGIRGPEDVKRLADVGVDAVLVGESLMRHPDPETLLRQMASVPRPPIRRGDPARGSHQGGGGGGI